MALKPSMGGLISPSLWGLASGYSMAVVRVRVWTLTGVSLFPPPSLALLSLNGIQGRLSW